MVDDYDRWKCRDFLHDVLRVVPVVQLPLFWYYLVENKVEVLTLLDDDDAKELQGLCQLWQALTPRERRDVLTCFVSVMERVTKDVACEHLPRKEKT